MRYIDTNIFLYVVEGHPEFGGISKKILERADNEEDCVTSTINLAEVSWWLEKHDESDRIEEIIRLIDSILNLKVISLNIKDFMRAGSFARNYLLATITPTLFSRALFSSIIIILQFNLIQSFFFDILKILGHKHPS